MKDTFHILFNFESERWSAARQFFTAIGRAELAAEPERVFGYTFDFDSESELENFQTQAARFGFADSYNVRRERLYGAADLREAQLLWIRVTLDPVADGGQSSGTKYDVSPACPKCGSGARQISPLFLKSGDLSEKSKVAATEDGKILFQEATAKKLIEGGFPQDSLGEVRDAEDNETLPWRQLRALAELPPMLPETQGIVKEDGCPKCGRDGYFHDVRRPIEIRYDISEADLKNLPAVVETWERFGYSHLSDRSEESAFASPLLIIKQEIYRLFQRLKIKGLEFIPIRLSESRTKEVS